MNQLGKCIKDNVLNEDKIYLSVMNADTVQNDSANIGRRRIWLKSAMALATVLILVLGSFTYSIIRKNSVEAYRFEQSAHLKSETHSGAFAMLSVDINPSFEIFVNRDNVVVEINPINDDAKSLDVSSFIGLKSQKAVVEIIKLASDSGFIKMNDKKDDYVLVTSVVLDDEYKGAEEFQDELENDIDLEVEKSVKELGTIKVAMLKATRREFFEAVEKEVPLGLYVINGMIANEDGDMITVSEFVKESKNLRKLENRARWAEKHQENNGKDDRDNSENSEDVESNEDLQDSDDPESEQTHNESDNTESELDSENSKTSESTEDIDVNNSNDSNNSEDKAESGAFDDSEDLIDEEFTSERADSGSESGNSSRN